MEQKQLGHANIFPSQPNTPGIPPKSRYADVGTSYRKSGSPTIKSSKSVGRPRSNTMSNAKKRPFHPNTPLVASPLIRQNYVSSSTQTESEDEDVWYRPPAAPSVVKRTYMSLTKRLLLRSQRDRAKLEERRKFFLEHSGGLTTNGIVEATPSISAPGQENTDIEMQNLGSAHPPPSTHIPEDIASNISHPISGWTATGEIKPPPPWSPTEQTQPINGYHSSNLRVHLPSKPSFPSDPAPNTVLVETPTSAPSQSPFTNNPPTIIPPFSHSSSSLVQPSPIKKKVSLGEYFSRRKGSQTATEMQTSSSPTMLQGTLKPPSLTNGVSKEAELQGSAVIDTPKGEENNPMEQAKHPKP